MTGKPFSIAAARFAVPILRLLSTLEVNRRVRAEARLARKNGMTDRMRDSVFASVLWLIATVSDDEASEQYAKERFSYDLGQRMPGLDPATIMILVQLAWLIYQALKAAGYLDRDSVQFAAAGDLNEHFGGL